jgi:hypothetical protein
LTGLAARHNRFKKLKKKTKTKKNKQNTVWIGFCNYIPQTKSYYHRGYHHFCVFAAEDFGFKDVESFYGLFFL